jgi:hypothetical protein
MLLHNWIIAGLLHFQVHNQENFRCHQAKYDGLRAIFPVKPAAQCWQREFRDCFSFWVEEWNYNPLTGEKSVVELSR